jgi:dethiobiotin synthetase
MSQPKNQLFITSTGTGIGKTAVTCALTRQLIAKGKQVRALKPVISGYTESDPTTDTALLLQSQSLTQQDTAHISPWRFEAALSPHMAAAREGQTLALQDLVAFCQTEAQLHAITLVEGAGGVLVPLTMRHTMADWMVALNWPVALVAGTYLGTISHTLTAAEALARRGLHLAGVVLCESESSPVPPAETAETLTAFLSELFENSPPPVLRIPRLKNPSDANAWPDLTRLVYP